MKKRIIGIVALILAFFVFVSGCAGGENLVKKNDIVPKPNTETKADVEDNNTDIEESDSEETVGDILTEADIIGKDGRFIYRVIYDKDIESSAVSECKNLRRQISTTCDIMVYYESDKDTPEDKDFPEILIGDTDRAESAQALKLLKNRRENNSKDYLIKKIDDKICVVAMDDKYLAKAIRKLTTGYFVSYEAMSKIGDNFELWGAYGYAGNKAQIAGNSLSDYVIVKPEKMSLLYSERITEFADAILYDYGFEIGVMSEDTAVGKNEIVIGQTNRTPENTLGYYEYRLLEKNGNLYLMGGSDIAISAAIDKLLEIENTFASKKKSFNIESGFEFNGTVTNKKGGYNLVWNDEFNGTSLNTSVWNTVTNEDITVLGGKLTRTPIEEFSIRDGNLVVPARKLSEKDFTSSHLETAKSLAIMYGIIEARIKFAPEYMTTGFGLMALTECFEYRNGKYYDSLAVDGKPGLEIDIVENFGYTDSFQFNIHKWRAGGGDHWSLDGSEFASTKKYKADSFRLDDDFHIYSLEWTPYVMKVAVDGKVFFELDLVENQGWDFTRQPLPISLGAGFYEKGYGRQDMPDGIPDYNEALFDYVRVYQSDEYDNILWIGKTN